MPRSLDRPRTMDLPAPPHHSDAPTATEPPRRGRLVWVVLLVVTALAVLVVVVLALLAAAIGGFFGNVTLAIDPAPAECHETDVPILRAAYAGDLDALQREIDEGRRDQRDADGRTALYCAARGGQEAATARLLAAGADPDVANAAGDTPLLWAAQEGDLATVEALLAGGAAVDQATDADHTPLLRAAYAGHEEVVARLLAAGADPDRPGGIDAFRVAVLQSGLLPGDDVTSGPAADGEPTPPVVVLPTPTGTAADGVTPLHAAVAYDHREVVAALLAGGASPDAVALGGYTPLHVAALLGRTEVAEQLLAAGAEVSPTTATTDVPPPSDLARKAGHDDTAAVIESAAG